MRVSDFYNDSIITEGFGKSRTFQVVRHLKSIWPGFPSRNEDLRIYEAAWLLWIFGNCKTSNPEDVKAAILRGRELKCEGELFITWFGDLLLEPEQIARVESIYIFYDGDNCVQVLYKDGSIKIFQGERKANSIRRAAILYQEFLFDLSILVSRAKKDHWPNWSYGEDGVYLDDPFVRIGKTGKNILDRDGRIIGTEVVDDTGTLVGLIENDHLKVLNYE